MITLTKKQIRKPIRRRVKIEALARTELDRHCHFRGRVDGFHFEYLEGVLTVRGRVPSFYLRELLERVLMRVDGVQSINNQVDVVCCDGLSSVRKNVTQSVVGVDRNALACYLQSIMNRSTVILNTRHRKDRQ